MTREQELVACIRKGVEMRDAQQEFFNAPDRNNRGLCLQRAKRLESEFDRMATAALGPQGRML